ncbi:MAG: ribosome assembly RNA-binding protein YhbY [Clostridia bacterium]
MTSQERAVLRGLAMKLQPTTQIGKNGINEALLQQINEQLDAHELIKISVLQNADFGAKDIINDLAQKCKAEPVQAIGSKITLYKKSSRKDFVHLI